MSAEDARHVEQTAGPIYLGILLNVSLYGILAGQFIAYSLSFRRQSWHNKALVYTLFFLNTLQTVLLVRDGFATFATGFGKLEVLDKSHLEWFSVPFITSFVSMLVQTFFAYRIYLAFGRSVWIPAVIVLASLTQGIAGLMAGTKDLRIKFYSLLYEEAWLEMTVWHVAAALCDILIAASMGYYLYAKDHTFRGHSYVSQIIRLSLETGTVTAIVTIANLILFFSAPGKIYFVTPAFLSAKLYTHTVFVVLNNRAQIVTGAKSPQSQFRKSIAAWDDRSPAIAVELHDNK